MLKYVSMHCNSSKKKYIAKNNQSSHPSNNLTLLLGFIMPLFLVLSFSFIVPPILKVIPNDSLEDKTFIYLQRIVYEKETGVKELMKMMGLPSWMHWVRTCTKNFCNVFNNLSPWI